MSISLHEQTATATRWSTITELSVRIILPVVNIVLARLLTPEAFGVVATVTMIVSFAEIFADAGFQKYIIQHDFKDINELDQVTNVAFATNLFISLLLWTIIFIFCDSLAALVGNPGLGNVVVVAALSLPLQALSSIQMSRFKRDMDFRSLFYIRLLGTIVPLIVTIPLAFITRSYWALVIGTLITNVANAIILTIRSSWHPRIYYSWKQLKEMFSYSWWILLESISTWMTSYSDTFVVSLYLSTYYVGLYKTSMVTVNQIMGLIVAATSGPLFVALTRMKNEKQQLFSTYNDYMQAIAMFVFPLSAGIWIYRDVITDILLGNQWGEASGFIGLWGLFSSVALVMGTYANGLYNAVGKTFLSFSVSLLNLLFMIPVLIIVAPKGFNDLYISRSCLRLFFVITQLVTMKLFLKYPVRDFIKRFAPPFIITLIMGLVALLLRQISDNFIWTMFTIAISVIVYYYVCRKLFKNITIKALETLGVPQKIINLI